MARYQYAKDQLGQVVRAIDLVGKEQQSDFICLGCDNILIAKVNGKIKQPHFAHKSMNKAFECDC